MKPETVKPIRLRCGSDLAVYGDNELIKEEDEWFNHPHSLTFGFLTLGWFIYAAFYDESAAKIEDPVYHTSRGIKYACFFFLVYCTLQLRDGHFIRPHPAIWRLITGLYILYEMFLVILLFQTTKDVRQLFANYIDPALGQPLPSRDYASNCEIYSVENGFKHFLNVLIDPFVPMHFFGWIIGALMVRSYIVCWFVSIIFEVYEMTFQHWLPNFKECWWDHLVLDIFLCNAAGIYCGMQICYYFEMKKYNWVGRKILLGKSPNPAKRALRQFLPDDWLPYEWEMFRSGKRFCNIVVMILALSVMMLNSFFLKSVLWIPTTHYLNILRLVIWYSAGAYGVAEYYIFSVYNDVDNKKPVQYGNLQLANDSKNQNKRDDERNNTGRRHAKKLGPRAWLSFLVVVTEVCVIVKHGKGMFTEPFPWMIQILWCSAFVIIGTLSVVYFTFINKKNETLSLNMKQE